MKKLLCTFNFHKWLYRDGQVLNIEDNTIQETQYRACKICGREEVFINEGPVSGMADFSYWKNVKKLSQKSASNCIN